MISIKQKGDFSKSIKFLNFLYKRDFIKNLERYGQEGVDALAAATPVDSGLTASSWDYSIHTTKNSVYITWTNDNMSEGIPIAVLIQYGHATANGGFVQGRDYINPVIRPVFDRIANAIWSEVVKA